MTFEQFKRLVEAADEAQRAIKRIADRIRMQDPPPEAASTLEHLADRLSRSVFEYRRTPGDSELAEVLSATGDCIRRVKGIVLDLKRDGAFIDADLLEAVNRGLVDANFDASAVTQPLSVDEITGRRNRDGEGE